MLAWMGRVAVCAISMFATGCADDEDAASDGDGEDGSTSAEATTDGASEEDTAPLPEPEPGPGACGWSGDGFACGWAPSAAQACPAGTEIFGACEGESPCCLDEQTLLTCQCLDNACDFQWRASDCIHGAGAGACGWAADAGAYVCGGAGADPGGAPLECPPADPSQPCDSVPLGTSCCDADGNARLCTDLGSNGNPYWSMIDCVLGD